MPSEISFSDGFYGKVRSDFKVFLQLAKYFF